MVSWSGDLAKNRKAEVIEFVLNGSTQGLVPDKDLTRSQILHHVFEQLGGAVDENTIVELCDSNFCLYHFAQQIRAAPYQRGL
jgi:hypothetical protein